MNGRESCGESSMMDSHVFEREGRTSGQRAMGERIGWPDASCGNAGLSWRVEGARERRRAWG